MVITLHCGITLYRKPVHIMLIGRCFHAVLRKLSLQRYCVKHCGYKKTSVTHMK